MLTVVNVAYPMAPVRADAVGGAEQVLAGLDAALTDAGHRSIVLACAGSRVAGELVEISAPGALLDDAERARLQAAMGAALRDVMARGVPDVIHLHGIDFDTYLPPAGPPLLATLHLPPSWYPSAALRPDRPRSWVHCVSRAQHAACSGLPGLLPPIGNGVALHRLRPGAGGDHAVVLARICPEKNVGEALAAAHAADCDLLIGGAVFPYPAHLNYFREEVAPLLDGRRRFLGALDRDAVRDVLAGARCLLVPSLAPETSSLVAMEALACGTPVIAYRAGALPEIVEDGVTGFLVDDLHGMVRALRDVASISRARCRAEAEARFDFRVTASAYLRRYAELAAS